MVAPEVSEPAAPPGWASRYLAFLGVEHPAPDLDGLVALTRAHLAAVPFENVTALLRRHQHLGEAVPPLDPATILDAWEDRRAGGVCFEIAGMVARLLTALGYRAYPVLGAITFPGSHQAVVVELDRQRYLVDVGCGAPLFEPIPLDRPIEVRRAGLAYRFRPDETGDGWTQDRWIEGAWAPFCRYDLQPTDPRAQETAYQRHHTPGQSWVVGSVRLIRCAEDAVYVLRDGAFTSFREAGKETVCVAEPAAYAGLAAEAFNLPGLPIEDGLAALSALLDQQSAS